MKEMEKYDYLIVGSGLYGATFAYFAKRKGKNCLVIDKRPHVGGNVYCEQIEGINVHKYGAHIFHTSDKKVWDFVNTIVPFNRYTNSPIARYKDRLYNLPFNMNTFYQLWGVTTPAQAIERINMQRREALAEMGITDVASFSPANLEEQALSLVGRDVYEVLIKGYTEKQWGRPCRELPPFILMRLPLRMTFDNKNFNDSYQGIPIGGYNKLIDGLLDGVECKTSCDFFTVYRDNWRDVAQKLVYTGPVDQYFDFRLGRLDWRTVYFKHYVKNIPNYQGNAVVNYTDVEVPYTRVIEHKHFEMFGPDVDKCPKTVVSEEYPAEYSEGMEPFYPVNNIRNNKLAEAYQQMSRQEDDVLFGGRLGCYKYYDMAPVIGQVMQLWAGDSEP